MTYKIVMKIFVNLITTLRMFFSFSLLFFIPRINSYVFLLIIIILFLTDFLDGVLARRFCVQTLYGSTMDTIADKTLSIILLLPLVEKLNSTFLILLGELGISTINVCGRLQQKITKSSICGKIKMWFLAITIVLGYLCYFVVIDRLVVEIGVYITLVFQCYVSIRYIFYLRNQNPVKKEKNFMQNKENLLYVLFNTEYYLDKSKL